MSGFGTPRVETYLYEGVRRVQERVTDPSASPTQAGREYIDGRDYVDEVLFQFDEAGDAFYVLQDANYNVVALLKSGSGVPPEDLVVEQYTYSPYGEILAADVLDPNNAPLTRIGFQGLFFDRLDASPDNQRLDPNSFGHYHARNRWYRPDLGRFTTKDVNATALPIMAALTVNAESFNILLGNFSGPELYGDGMNLYLFAGGNPVIRNDPSGLAWHHLYPCYLGGNRYGPGIWLKGSKHTVFHNTLASQLKGGTPDAQRKEWLALKTEDARKSKLIVAASAAGIDVSDPRFTEALNEAYQSAEKHGVKVPRRDVTVGMQRRVRGGSVKISTSQKISRIKALKVSSMARGMAVGSAVLASSRLLVLLDFDDPHLHALALATRRARNGGLSLSDEAFGLMDMYALTGDPMSAGWAWTTWSDGLNE